jgi:hypothetical protein
MNMQNKILGSIPFFQQLNEALVGDLVLHLQPLRVEAAEMLYHRGDKATLSTSGRKCP